MGWWDRIKEGVSEAAYAVGNTVGKVARLQEVALQGVVRGLASGVAAVGDLAVNVGYNWTTRHLTDNEKYETNWSDKAAEAVTWTEPRNETERKIMVTGQVVGEIGALAAITVATAGVGGAAVGGSLAVARGATAARAVTSAVNTGTRAATATARVVNPLDTSTKLAKAGVALEAAMAPVRWNQLHNEDLTATENAQSIRETALTTLVSDAMHRQTALQNSLQRASENATRLLSALEDPTLSDERYEAMNGEFETAIEHNNILQSLRDENLDGAQRQTLMQRLEEIDPAFKAEMNAPADAGANPQASYTATFSNAVANTQSSQPLPANTINEIQQQHALSMGALTV